MPRAAAVLDVTAACWHLESEGKRDQLVMRLEFPTLVDIRAPALPGCRRPLTGLSYEPHASLPFATPSPPSSRRARRLRPGTSPLMNGRSPNERPFKDDLTAPMPMGRLAGPSTPLPMTA